MFPTVVNPSRNNHVTIVEGFGGPHDPKSNVVKGKGSIGEYPVTGPLSMVSSRVRPKIETGVHPHMGQSPTGGAKGVWCGLRDSQGRDTD